MQTQIKTKETISCPAVQKHKTSYVQYLALIAIMIILPFIVPTYFLDMLGKIYIFAIFAMGLNLVLGYTGLVSLGHAAYLGVGGYTFGILMVRLGIDSLWILLPCSILIAAIAAAIFGYIALRVKGMHFILITIAFGQLLYAVAVKWRSVTGSTDGLIGINYPSIGLPGFEWSPFTFYFLLLFMLIICYFLMHRITNSSFGYALVGIRENEARMQGLGYNTWLYKYLAFIIGGAFAGVSGSLLAPFYGIVVPGNFALLTSSMAILIVVLGSAGTLYGPVIGAIIIILLEFFASIYSPERWPLVLGAVFIICITLFKGGVGRYLESVYNKTGSLIWKK